jgi:hypothetical protein
MSIMSDLAFERDSQQSSAERWVRDFAGGPIAVVQSEGYWQIADSEEPGEDAQPVQTAVSARRQYSLGIIAAGEVQVEDYAIIVPVEGSVTWSSDTPYVQDSDSRFDWGLEWLDADITAGEGGLVLPRIQDVRDFQNVWRFNERVATKGKALGLSPGMRVEKSDTVPAGMVTGTFAEVKPMVNAGVCGDSTSRYIRTGEEARDKLFGRIIGGDVSALEEAADPDAKKAAAEAAREDFKLNSPKPMAWEDSYDF